MTKLIYNDILEVCIKRRGMYGYSVALGVVMSGFPAILIKNHVCAPIRNVTVLIGKNQENGGRPISNFLITAGKCLILYIDNGVLRL